jgi:hypothetical protein
MTHITKREFPDQGFYICRWLYRHVENVNVVVRKRAVGSRCASNLTNGPNFNGIKDDIFDLHLLPLRYGLYSSTITVKRTFVSLFYKRNTRFRGVRKSVKSYYYRVVMSVCPSAPHGTTSLPLKGFSWYLSVFRKSAEKNLRRITGTLYDDVCKIIFVGSIPLCF